MTNLLRCPTCSHIIPAPIETINPYTILDCIICGTPMELFKEEENTEGYCDICDNIQAGVKTYRGDTYTFSACPTCRGED